MKRIYILLTRSQSLLSRLIGRCTDDAYTHVSVAFDAGLSTLCSFARRDARFPLPAGLVRERLDAGYFGEHRHIPCTLLACPVEERALTEARDHVEWMLCAREAYRYSLRGVLCCALGIPQSRPGRYFCSQFAAEVLENCGCALPRQGALMRPQDFVNLPNAQPLYRGRISGLAREWVGRAEANVEWDIGNETLAREGAR